MVIAVRPRDDRLLAEIILIATESGEAHCMGRRFRGVEGCSLDVGLGDSRRVIGFRDEMIALEQVIAMEATMDCLVQAAT